MKKGRFVLVFLIAGICSSVPARIIKGVVTGPDNAPIMGVKVSSDASHYTYTGADGKFELNADVFTTSLSL